MISVLHLGTIDYGTSLELQRSLVGLRQRGNISDVLLLLEHPPVITLGRNARREHLLASSDLLKAKGVELFESNRGGDITFHGPGQLVGYPIFDLRGFSPRMGAVEFVRRVEEALIRTCGDLGILSERICGLTGVWTQGPASSCCSGDGSKLERAVLEAPPPGGGQKKIAAIGVHISRGITSHGFALNVATDLEFFKLIVPCGISDRQVTSVANEVRDHRPVPNIEEVAHSVSRNFGRVFKRQMLWLESLDALLNPGKPPENQASEADPSTTIGVPLQVPKDLREVRREQKAPQVGGEDEIFLA